MRERYGDHDHAAAAVEVWVWQINSFIQSAAIIIKRAIYALRLIELLRNSPLLYRDINGNAHFLPMAAGKPRKVSASSFASFSLVKLVRKAWGTTIWYWVNIRVSSSCLPHPGQELSLNGSALVRVYPHSLQRVSQRLYGTDYHEKAAICRQTRIKGAGKSDCDMNYFISLFFPRPAQNSVIANSKSRLIVFSPADDKLVYRSLVLDRIPNIGRIAPSASCSARPSLYFWIRDYRIYSARQFIHKPVYIYIIASTCKSFK